MRLKEHTIYLRNTEKLNSRLPFTRFVVIDKRFDTSKIGYMMKHLSFAKIVSSQPFAIELEEKLNQLIEKTGFHYGNGPRLFVFIKHFWVQETSHAEATNNKIGEDMSSSFLSSKVTLECFLEKDSSYVPMFRYDTLVLKRISNNREIGEEVSGLIRFFLQHLEKFDWSKPKKKLTEADMFLSVDRFRNEFRKPVTEAGLYVSFDDFRKGNLLRVKFEVKEGRTDELYLIENGERRLLRDFWGYSDGMVEYMNTGFNFFQLVRVGNTYEIWGKKNLIKGRVTFDGAIEETWVRHKPWQLNMETGQLY